MNWISDPQALLALVTLTALEIVLGIDNIIFISILVAKLPADRQKMARLVGLGLAMASRIALLFSLSWVMSLTKPLISWSRFEPSGRDLILLFGGLFLLGKATHEIHEKLEGDEGSKDNRGSASLASILIQIAVLDIVFSLDSVITAIGMARDVGVMVTAVVISVGFMMVFAKSIGDFVHRHPTIKMLALSFLLLIGVLLVAEAFHQHIPKGYVYFAMAFSVFVEFLNMRAKGASQPVKLREPYTEKPSVN